MVGECFVVSGIPNLVYETFQLRFSAFAETIDFLGPTPLEKSTGTFECCVRFLIKHAA